MKHLRYDSVRLLEPSSGWTFLKRQYVQLTMIVDYEISYYIITFLKKFSPKMAPERRAETCSWEIWLIIYVNNCLIESCAEIYILYYIYLYDDWNAKGMSQLKTYVRTISFLAEYRTRDLPTCANREASIALCGPRICVRKRWCEMELCLLSWVLPDKSNFVIPWNTDDRSVIDDPARRTKEGCNERWSRDGRLEQKMLSLFHFSVQKYVYINGQLIALFIIFF